MKDREAGVLYDLQGELQLQHEGGVLVGVKGAWFRPMDVGGGDGTHHSVTLRRLVAKGWVEKSDRSGMLGRRGSNVYRITLEGVRALANRQALIAAPEGSVHAPRGEHQTPGA